MLHTFDGSHYTKNEKYMKNVIVITFFYVFLIFSCSRVHKKYSTWVFLRWRIKFCIQRVLPLEIWVKLLRDKLKIRVEKVVLLFYYFLIFLIFYSKNVESSPMLDIIVLNPIGFYEVYFGCTFFLGDSF